MERLRSVRLALLVAALLVAAASDLAFLISALPQSIPTDFQMYWQVGQSAEAYAARSIPFVNPPSALLLIKPLGQLPFAQAFLIWTAASIGLFLWGASRHAGLFVAALSLIPLPAVRGIFLGQISLLLSGLILLGFSVPGFAGGLLLGIAAAMKPQLVLLAPVALIVRKDWPMLFGMAAGSIGLALASTLLWPEAWPAWLGSLTRLQGALDDLGVQSLVITPAGRAESFGLPSLPFLLLGIGVSLTAVCMLARRLEGPHLAGLVIAASLFASPYALLHDLVALMPVAILMILRGGWPVALAGAALFCVDHQFAPYLFGGGMVALIAWQTLRPREVAERPFHDRRVGVISVVELGDR